MNKLTPFEKKEWLKYSKINGNPLRRCKINELIIFPNNNFEHEQGKFNLFWQHLIEGHKLLTECYISSRQNDIPEEERCDVVCLTCAERYEIESSISRAKRFIGRPINIVPVNWDKEDEKWTKRVAEKKK